MPLLSVLYDEIGNNEVTLSSLDIDSLSPILCNISFVFISIIVRDVLNWILLYCGSLFVSIYIPDGTFSKPILALERELSVDSLLKPLPRIVVSK